MVHLGVSGCSWGLLLIWGVRVLLVYPPAVSWARPHGVDEVEHQLIPARVRNEYAGPRT